MPAVASVSAAARATTARLRRLEKVIMMASEFQTGGTVVSPTNTIW
jgi:hypothetical protein